MKTPPGQEFYQLYQPTLTISQFQSQSLIISLRLTRQYSAVRYYSQVILVPKPEQRQLCVDYRNVNSCTEPASWPISASWRHLGQKPTYVIIKFTDYLRAHQNITWCARFYAATNLIATDNTHISSNTSPMHVFSVNSFLIHYCSGKPPTMLHTLWIPLVIPIEGIFF